jgi:hypothetical protein
MKASGSDGMPLASSRILKEAWMTAYKRRRPEMGDEAPHGRTMNDRPRILIYGAGSIGSFIGALLAEGGADVTLLVRGAHADAIAAARCSNNLGAATATSRQGLPPRRYTYILPSRYVYMPQGSGEPVMTARRNILASDFTEQPYWWRDRQPGDASPADVPGEVDVAIVGTPAMRRPKAMFFGRGPDLFFQRDAVHRIQHEREVPAPGTARYRHGRTLDDIAAAAPKWVDAWNKQIGK